MKNQPYYIVVINDDQAMRLSCYKILRKEGYKVATFDDEIVGLEHISRRKPDLLIINLKMSRLGGIGIISRVHAIDSDICIIVITGYTTLGAATEAIKNGAYDFLPQPFTADELRLIVRRGLERRMLEKKIVVLKQENERLQRQFTTFVSHQLQSPLADLKRYLEALAYLPDTPKRQQAQKEWIDLTLTRITELLGLVSNWLKISKN